MDRGKTLLNTAKTMMIAEFMNKSTQYLGVNMERKEIKTIDLGPRLGYPKIGEVVKTSQGTITYTETGLVFKGGNGYGVRGQDE